MEPSEVREALKTAILLGEVAQTSHTIEINGIGEVQIDRGNALLKAQSGQWKRVTRKNLDKWLDELMSESFENRVKRQIGTLVFS
ncbi:hypothetical protein KJ966_04540 [bacterium]|nr:hypothetical protein [bacterium]